MQSVQVSPRLSLRSLPLSLKSFNAQAKKEGADRIMDGMTARLQMLQKCDGGFPSCRKCRESREVVECIYRESETVKSEPPAELPLVPVATPQEVPLSITKPYQLGAGAVLDPFNWTPLSWAIRELFGPSSYSLSGVSPEDMNLRL